MKRSLIALSLCACAFGQSPVTLTDQPAPEALERLHYRDGSSNYEYECVAKARSATSYFTRSASTSLQPGTTIATATLTSIVVLTNVATATTSGAHGLRIGARVTVLGATVDEDLGSSAVPKNYTIASVPSSTTFTFATSSVADATYNESTLYFSTQQPRSNSNAWAIVKRFYTTTYIDREFPAYGSNGMDKACDSRAAYFQ